MQEEPVTDATDGWHDGYQYFMCKHGRGVFLHLTALRRDDRFINVCQTETQNRKLNDNLTRYDDVATQ